MNYFAHGRHFIDDPFMLAGTAVPDWLNVVDRRVRARPARAAPRCDDTDPCLAAVARGIVQHHDDDRWFHATDAFGELSWNITALCREALPNDEGFRPSFLGHILVELLLDAALIAADHAKLSRYYDALESLDPRAIERAVNQITAKPADRLAWFIERFCQVRFLYDYADDAKLWFRLNQVLSRVRLSPLPVSFVEVIAAARESVTPRAAELLGKQPHQKRIAG
jgi:hypothetical protein